MQNNIDLSKTVEQFDRAQREDFLSYLGYRGVDTERGRALIGRMPVGSVLELMGINAETFAREYAEWLESRGQLHFTKENKGVDLYGRIPCVVQLPFQECLDREWGADRRYNIAMAEFGQHWLDEVFTDTPPSFLIGAGIEGMVTNDSLKKYDYSWKDYEMPLNGDFAGMEDPEKRFRILAAIPIVLVADLSLRRGREVPQSFDRLLDPAYRDSIVYPDDGQLLQSILPAYFYRAGGIEAVHEFHANAICGAHPSQMIKPGGLEKEPFLMLMPWVFARIKAAQKNMQLIWLDDGAPILPVVITARDSGRSDPKARDFLLGPEIGNIFRAQGFFPSANPLIKNELPGKLRFIGWDFLYGQDLPGIIDSCKSILENK